MSKPAYRLRPVVLADVPMLVMLSDQLGYAIEPELVDSNLRRMLGNGDHCLIAAVDEADLPVGWIHGFARPLVESPLMVELGGLVVDSAWRGRSLGRALLAAVETWARAEGVTTLTVRSGSQRDDAHRFYLGLGYELVKTQQVFRKRL
jgi:GNAT superfamily N-acetyltransferase